VHGLQKVGYLDYSKVARAVPTLTVFEYDHNLGTWVAAKHHWDLLGGDKYYVSFVATQGVWKSVFNVNPPASYTEEPYPGNEGKGIHSVAKLCAMKTGTGLSGGKPALSCSAGMGCLTVTVTV